MICRFICFVIWSTVVATKYKRNKRYWVTEQRKGYREFHYEFFLLLFYFELFNLLPFIKIQLKLKLDHANQNFFFEKECRINEERYMKCCLWQCYFVLFLDDLSWYCHSNAQFALSGWKRILHRFQYIHLVISTLIWKSWNQMKSNSSVVMVMNPLSD